MRRPSLTVRGVRVAEHCAAVAFRLLVGGAARDQRAPPVGVPRAPGPRSRRALPPPGEKLLGGWRATPILMAPCARARLRQSTRSDISRSGNRRSSASSSATSSCSGAQRPCAPDSGSLMRFERGSRVSASIGSLRSDCGRHDSQRWPALTKGPASSSEQGALGFRPAVDAVGAAR